MICKPETWDFILGVRWSFRQLVAVRLEFLHNLSRPPNFLIREAGNAPLRRADSQCTHVWEGLLVYPKENGTPEKLRTPGRRPRAAERVRLCRCSCEREGGRPRGLWDTGRGVAGTQRPPEEHRGVGVLKGRWILSQGGKREFGLRP